MFYCKFETLGNTASNYHVADPEEKALLDLLDVEEKPADHEALAQEFLMFHFQNIKGNVIFLPRTVNNAT